MESYVLSSATSNDASNEGQSNEPILGSPANPLHTVMTIPNLITLCRLILTVLFLFLYMQESTRILSIIFFIIAATTDWFDGQVARRFNQVSVFGKRFDPIMDRVLIFSGILALVLTNRVPVWVVVFLIARDAYLLIGGMILYRQKHSIIDVVFIGKVCTFVLMTGFAIQLLGIFTVPGLGIVESAWLPGLGAEPVSFGIWVIYVGCILSFITACIYTKRGYEILRTEKTPSA